MTQNATASGAMRCAGSAALTNVRPPSASGAIRTGGSAAAQTGLPGYSFGDFGIWDYGQPDAAVTRLRRRFRTDGPGRLDPLLADQHRAEGDPRG